MLRYQEIKQNLLKEIADKEPLERLPSRLELCKRLDTTRTTLDKAIKELEREGIVFCKDGSGTYVAIPKGYDIKRPENWGLLVPDNTLDVYAELIRGVESVTDRNNINLILCNFDHDLDKQEQYIRRLMLTGVSGLILVPVIHRHSGDDRRVHDMLTHTNKPIVFCNMGISGIRAPIVASNNFYGGYLATRHLIGRGYRRIAYLSEFEYRTSVERCQGYIAALQEADIPFDASLVVTESSRYAQDNGYRAACVLFEERPDIDAVFCFSDFLADGVYRAAERYDKRISDDLGVIGYDNRRICAQLTPSLTTLAYRSEEIGRTAAELLLEQIRGNAWSGFPYRLFQPELVERDSCRGRTGYGT